MSDPERNPLPTQPGLTHKPDGIGLPDSQRWEEIAAADYAAVFAAYGGSFAVHPRVVALLAALSGRPIRYFGCERDGRLIAAAPVLDGQIVASYPAVERLGLSQFIDVGHGEVVLPIEDGATLSLPFRGDLLSSLHGDSIRNLQQEKGLAMMLARGHRGQGARLSSRMKGERRRLLRRFLEIGGSYRPLSDLPPDEIARIYVALFAKRWGSNDPQGWQVLPQVVTALHDLLLGFLLCFREEPVAIQIAYAVETPRFLLAVGTNGGYDRRFSRYSLGSALLYLNTRALDEQAQRLNKTMRYCFGFDDAAYKRTWCYPVPLYQAG